MPTNQHMNILTEKGLRYIVEHGENPEAVVAAKHELHRRGFKVHGLTHDHSRRGAYLPREHDGYEKDK